MNLWIIVGAIATAVLFLFPKKEQAANAAFTLPFKPAQNLHPDVEQLAKLLEVKRYLIEKGMPVADADTKFSDIVPHLTNQPAAAA